MKNRTVWLIIIFSSFLLPVYSQASKEQTNEKKIVLTPFTRLIVKSNVRVVLVETEQPDTARIEGNKKFLETVLIIQAGEDLVVRARSFKDLKKQGTIYIPVHNLRHLEVNADAKIIAYTTIRSPQLQLMINGDCILSIILNGKLKIDKEEGFEYTFRRVNYQSNTPVDLNNFIKQ